ncbi:YdcF family protein, partial [Candidatus Omnitrophota bacterium]
GGVGETGSPGKSTIERAMYASRLYLGGYAGKVIVSSGYTYVYNDAENMRLLALSMGVPDKDIILENRANSAYENVMFSKKILDKNNWDSILLVSSPYNMRRLSSIFNKQASYIKVFYTPVEMSQFYNRTYGVKIEQIRAIMHEYLGIIYYWVKGYI